MPRGGNKYRFVQHGQAADLGDGLRYRSAWERNVRRILAFRAALFGVIAVCYESEELPLKGYKYRGNPLYLSDFRVSLWKDTLTDVVWLIEVKGFLARGGRLAGLDLSSLKGRDDKSRIKLTGVQEQYPEVAQRMWVIGAREYRWLERRYASLIPEWEGKNKAASSPTSVKAVAKTPARTSVKVPRSSRRNTNVGQVGPQRSA